MDPTQRRFQRPTASIHGTAAHAETAFDPTLRKLIGGKYFTMKTGAGGASAAFNRGFGGRSSRSWS
jgi:hypothetical protein